MWSVAESKDPNAILEFQDRFPQYRLELMKRVNALSDLRKAKGGQKGVTPEFRPRPPAQGASRPARFAFFAFGGFLLAGIAAASFFAVSLALRGNPSAAAPYATRLGDASLQSSSKPSIDPVTPTPIPVVPNVGGEPASLPTADSKPMSLHIERAQLSTVLNALADQAQWQLTIAPGTPDPEIHVDYDGQSATSIVEDLGKRFGFTAFDEGQHQVLVVPAVDGRGPTEVAPETDMKTDGSAPIVAGP
jgi:hypothetical protein